MEEIKLPTVPELELIPIERRNFPEEDHKQEKIQHKRKERDSAARGLIAVTVASMMLNAVMAMIIYIYPEPGRALLSFLYSTILLLIFH